MKIQIDELKSLIDEWAYTKQGLLVTVNGRNLRDFVNIIKDVFVDGYITNTIVYNDGTVGFYEFNKVLEKLRNDTNDKIIPYELKNIVILCKTEEDANKILKIANKLGWQTNNNTKYNKIDNGWIIDRDETCYSFYDGGRINIQEANKERYIVHSVKWFLNKYKSI